MKTATTKKTSPEETSSRKQRSNVSEIDLDSLSLQDLVVLKREVDARLAIDIYPMAKEDVVLDYSLKLRSHEGVVGENHGSMRLPGLLNFRALAQAPQAFESSFLTQVFNPINNDAIALIESANYTGNRLSSARAQLVDDFNPAPGMRIPSLPGNFGPPSDDTIIPI